MPNIMEDSLGLAPGQLEFLDACPDADLQRLQRMFEQAREQQREATDTAIEAGLQIVPALLRKAVRKAFGGS